MAESANFGNMEAEVTEKPSLAWVEAWRNCQNDPYLFATGVLGFLPCGSEPGEGQVVLERWQEDLLKGFFIGPDGHTPVTDARHSIRAGHGVGKMQPKTEPVLTPAGWTEIGLLKAGDLVATVDGGFTAVTGIYPQGVKPVFRVVLDDGTWTLAGKDHLWHTTSRSERKRGNAGTVRTTAEIAQSLTFPNGPRNGLNHCLPHLSRPIQHPHADLPVDPYLLGVYLGDGTWRGTLTLNAADAEHYTKTLGDKVAGRGLYIRHRGTHATLVGRVNSADLRAIHDLGLMQKVSHEKFIPSCYLFASPAQRLALLQGLLDTDGTVGRKNNAITFDTASETLASGVAELVRSLGGVARRSGRQGRLNGEDKRWSHRVYVTLPHDCAPFLCPRKADLYRPQHGERNRDRSLNRFIIAVEEVGEADCVCISVAHPSRLYVTRDHILTHNTVLLSILALWWPLSHYDSKCVITANSQDQLRDTIWPELKKWANRLPTALREQIQIDGETLYVKAAPEMAFVVRRTSGKNNPESLQGFHAEYLLFLIDEASGIPDIVFEVAQGSLSTKGASAVMTANPTRASGFFYETHNKLRHRWRSWRVSSEDVPRARGHIQDVIDAYGKDSNKYRVRVLGEFPLADDDTVIPLTWVEAAIGRDVQPLDFLPIWGVDVARFGDDSSALAKRQANRLLEPVKEWLGKDNMQLVGLIHNEFINTPDDMQPKEILIDVIGMGSGVVDRCKELGLPVRGVNVGETASSDDRMMRLRDELWFAGRRWFEDRACSIPNDQKLISELVGPTYDYHSSGKIVVESKKDMKKRGLKSPNLADAFLLTFAGMAHRKQPIRRVYRGGYRDPMAS